MAPDDQAPPTSAPAAAAPARRGPGRPRKTPAGQPATGTARKRRAKPASAIAEKKPAEQAPKAPEAPEAPKAPLPDFDALALNLARLTTEGAKALAAYMRPIQEGRTNPDMAEHVEDAVKTFGHVAEYWLSDPARALDAQTRLTSELIAVCKDFECGWRLERHKAILFTLRVVDQNVCVLRVVETDHAVSPVNQLTGVALWNIEQLGKHLNRKVGSNFFNEIKFAFRKCVVECGCG